MKKVYPEGVGKSIFCMICGRMTPKQKDIVRPRAKVDTKMYMDILSWFIQKSGHSAFKDLEVPDTVPAPVVIEDSSSINNTDCEVNPSVENRFSGGTFNFTSPGEPTANTSTCGTERRFFLAMTNSSSLTLLSVGGVCKCHEMNVGEVLLMAFPFGFVGPGIN